MRYAYAGMPPVDPRMNEFYWWVKWLPWTKAYINCKDAEGELAHYPRAGGYFDQDCVEMEILAEMRLHFHREVNRERERQWRRNQPKPGSSSRLRI